MKRISRQALEAELDGIVRCLHHYAPQKVILFGSFARGDYNAGSDLDLLIIKETEQPFIERSADIWRVCPSSLPIEPLVYTSGELARMIEDDNPFIKQVLSEGIVIYEQQSERRATLA